jgi:thymidylate kinase
MSKEALNFYAIEGLDGVGKSTVADLLCQGGYLVFKTPTPELESLRKIFDKRDIKIRFAFYLLSVIHADHKIKKANIEVEKVCDRYLLSTIAAHEAMGLSTNFLLNLRPFFEKISSPSATFLLTADEEVRKDRLFNRGANETDMSNFEINKELLEGYRKWSDFLEHNLVEIDTSNLDPGNVVNLLETIIKEQKK